MNTIKIHGQISFLRKQKGLTQEALANALGVTNQSVSKWESGQCCPDIQLLPDIAKFFEVSVDELLGYTPASASDDIILMLRKKVEELPNGEDFNFTFRVAAALHAIIFSKMMTADNSNPGWDTDDAIEHAGDAEWGYSSCNIPEVTTTMRHGTVLFSSNKTLNLMNQDIRQIASAIKPFGDIKNIKIATALYQLTIHSEDSYATIAQISEKSGLPSDIIQQHLEKDLSEFVDETYGTEPRFRFRGRYLSLLPVISLFDIK